MEYDPTFSYHREMPISPELEFVPSPHIVDPQMLAAMSPDEIAGAQRAYNIFHTESNNAMAASRNHGGRRPNVSYETYKEVGFDQYVADFKALRRLYGETEYGGIEPVHITDENRTDLRQYLETASKGGMIIADWAGHDALLHLTGALLATDEVSKLVRTGARAGLRLPKDQQIELGNQIDDVTVEIQRLWRNPDQTNDALDQLAQRLTTIQQLTGINYCDQEDILFFVANQAAMIQKMRSTPLFMDAAYLPKVEATV